MPRRRLSPDRAGAPFGSPPAPAGSGAGKPHARLERPQDVPPGLVCLGAFAGARGVQGEVRIKPFTDDPLSVADYGPVRDREGRAFTLLDLRSHKDGLIARVEGVTTRDGAEALKGTAFYVDRAALPEPEDEDDFYQTDLIGLDALNEDGEALGTVHAVYDFGAGDLLELRLAGTGRLVLVPFTRDLVPVVDVGQGRIVVAPLPGLLEEGDAGPGADEDAGRDP
ncbi:MAG: ribosome maturation factor RimM [Alphaproteobacteria bacterium]